ncbi:MAG TPA: toxin-antitoxin system, antitoxin component, Xre family protein [Nitrospirae bacterium]|nr:toxin-antitoxin system, antitoxin component, Xre family protein [Nitrospirota bacterium]
MSVKDMIKKEIDKLPDSKLVEVYDFVKFLEIKQEREILQKTSQALSEKSFENIWDNEEDAVYDSI